MAEKFELFRLALLERSAKDLFDEEQDIGREAYLRKVFSEERRYNYADVNYHFVPASQAGEDETLIGRIGRSQTIEENKPPAEGLQEIAREQWKAAYIVIDPTEHEDGQKVAVEANGSVAAPSSLLLGLLRAINIGHPAARYSIEGSPIVDTATFWTFAEENKGNVTSVGFEFVVPNMLGIGDSITDELRDYREKEKARRVTIGISSSEGLETNTDRTKEAVEYISKAGGKIKASAKGKKRYSSTRKQKRTSIEKIEGTPEQKLGAVVQQTKKILGRE